MPYLYHRVPWNLEGSVLYPLNTLKDTHPEIHDHHIRKYEGREHVLESRIPSLNCMWNDVLFFTAVHPSLLRKAWEEIGIKLPEPFRFFEIDAQSFEPSDATVWLFERGKDDMTGYRSFEADSVEDYSQLPPETLEYYREQHTQGLRPFLFIFVPHILYRGSVDISSARIIEA